MDNDDEIRQKAQEAGREYAKRYIDSLPLVTKTCPVCGQEFQTRIASQVYDRPACKKKAARRRAKG